MTRSKQLQAFIALCSVVSLFFFFSCGPDTTTTANNDSNEDSLGAQAAAGLPNNSFYCMRAGKDTVERWLEQNGGGNNKHSRLVLSYYWPNRSNNRFTLISHLNTKTDAHKFDPNEDTLTTISTCQVVGIGNEIVLGSNQVPISVIRRLWDLSADPGRYIKFTPMVNSGVNETGQPCNCAGHLVYKIDLILSTGFPPTADYDPGYSNPSPPKDTGN